MSLSGAQKTRGAISNPAGRFEKHCVVATSDGWSAPEPGRAQPPTVRAEPARKIISTNRSPDIPFEQSINPYRGCEHGCAYCYARPTHAWLNLSPGLDFETQISYKENAAELLEEELSRPDYQCKPITLGANTDPYQPAEKSTGITRQLLELFDRYSHPVNLITKGGLVTRDLDLLASLASRGLCSVAISLPTMDAGLKRIMEPRVPSAEIRLKAITTLTNAGVPVSVLMAPLIPAINDTEIEDVLETVAGAGASHAHYIFLRLPHEVRDIFVEWLDEHFPERAKRVMSLIRQASGGRDYDNRFGRRQTGQGAYADMLRKRFNSACRRHGLRPDHYQQRLASDLFARPGQQQLGLNL